MEESIQHNQKERLINSRTIAEVVEKNHHNVMADIRGMCEQAGVTIWKSISTEKSLEINTQEVTDTEPVVIENVFYVEAGHTKRKTSEYLLNEMAAELLATGYDVKRRLKVLQLVKKLREEVEQKTKLDFNDPNTVLQLAKNWKEEHDKRIEAEKTIAIAAPKVNYHDKVLTSKSAIPTTIIAKDLGITAQQLNKFLHVAGIQYKCGDTWVLYREHQDKGYTKTVTDYNEEGQRYPHTVITMHWTELGRHMINNLWHKHHGQQTSLFV